LSFE
jgi:DNA-binding transcriptional LysR family regulator